MRISTAPLFAFRAVVVALLAASTLAGAQSPTAGRPIARRVWADSGLHLELGSPSPDGRSFTVVDQIQGTVNVRALDTRKSHPVTQSEKTKGWPWETVFSSDSRQVAYVWMDFESNRWGIRATSADSIAIRPVFVADSSVYWVSLFDWSRDGSTLLVRLDRTDRTSQLATVDARNGALRVLRTFSDWRVATQGRISPDGQQVAYSYPASRQDGRREMYLIAMAEGRESQIVRDPADDGVIGWSTDGSRLVFASDRGGSPGIWELPVTRGRPSGVPRQTRADLWRMIEGGRVTAAGQLFYRVQGGDADVFVASWDAQTGRLTSRAASVTRRPGAEYGSPSWSHDGQFVAYLTWHGDNGRVGSTSVTIHSPEKGTSRVLQPKVAYIQRLTWAPDGRSLVLHATDDKGQVGAQRLDLATGATTTLVDSINMLPVISRDGRTAYREGRSPRPGATLVATDLTTKTHRILWSAPDSLRVTSAYSRNEPNAILTRDGKQLVFGIAPPTRSGGVLHVIDVAGGTPRPLHPKFDKDYFTNVRVVGLSPDGKAVIFTTRRDIGTEALEAPTVWRVALAGGTPVQLQASVARNFRSLAVSADGRRVAFIAGDIAQELWMLPPPAVAAPNATGAAR